MLAGEAGARLFPFLNIHSCHPGLAERRKRCEEEAQKIGSCLRLARGVSKDKPPSSDPPVSHPLRRHREDVPPPIILMGPLPETHLQMATDGPMGDAALRDPSFTVRSLRWKVWLPWSKRTWGQVPPETLVFRLE